MEEQHGDRIIYPLDGVNDWVDLGQISLTNQVTLDTIVEINSASSEKQAILGNPQNGGVLLQIFEQKVYFWAWINGQSYYTIINSDTELTLGKPTRITGTFNGSKMCLYINGKLEASKSVSGTIVAPEESTPMAIGSNRKGTGTSGNGEFAKANIYSAKVYTQALTQAEIKQIWDVSELGDYSIMVGMMHHHHHIQLILQVVLICMQMQTQVIYSHILDMEAHVQQQML